MRKEARQSEQEVVMTLKEKIAKIPADQTGLDEMLDSAKTIVNQEEKIWSAFTGASRSRFLGILTRINQ